MPSSTSDGWADRVFDGLREYETELNSVRSRPGDPAKKTSDEFLLGILAVERGLLHADQLEEALRLQEDRRSQGQANTLGQVFVERGWIKPEDLASLLGEQRAPRGLPHFPRYEIESQLGEGATAIVYRARDKELGRPVAVKVLRDGVALSETARQRFRREAEAAASLSHPNIVQIHDLGESDGRLFLVMEIIEGRSLAEVMRDGQVGQRDLVRILERAARGIGSAHDRGIVHRDLKPANILVTPAGDPKVGDFGLAHLADSPAELTRTGTPLGTPLYMAPEQVEGRVKQISSRTDVYALGVILFELLTGRLPYGGESLQDLYRNVVKEDPPRPRRLNPKISVELETITLKALEKEPGRRYPSAKEFADDLARYLSDEPIAARPTGPLGRLYRKVRRNRLAWSFGVVLFLFSSAAFVVWRVGSVNRENAIHNLRERSRIALKAILDFRRAGANDRISKYLPEMEAAYREAEKSMLGLPEADYLMGRMYRVTMQDAKALDHQRRALQKDPRYGPSLYEEAILLAQEYGREVEKSRGSRKSSEENVAPTSPALAEIRSTILRDGATLLEVLREGSATAWPVPMTEANILEIRGIMAQHEGRSPEAQAILRSAVEKDPLLEQAWEILCRLSAEEADQEKSGDEFEKKSKAAQSLYEAAIRQDQGYLSHRWGIARLLLKRAERRRVRGLSPFEEYRVAELHLAAVVKQGPSYEDAWWEVGLLRTQRARWNREGGYPDHEAFSQASSAFWHVLQHNPQSLRAHRARGIVVEERGDSKADLGQDPLSDWTEAERYLVEATKRDPKNAEASAELGFVRTSRGAWRLRRGENPSPDFDLARADFARALELDGSSSRARHGAGRLAGLVAQYRMKRGEDPLREFETAERELNEAFRLDSSLKNPLVDRAEMKLARAVCTSMPLEDLAAAEEDLRQAIKSKAGWRPWFLLGHAKSEKGGYWEGRGQRKEAAKEYDESVRAFEAALRSTGFVKKKEIGEALAAAKESVRRTSSPELILAEGVAMDLVYVRPGSFTMGGTEIPEFYWQRDERPERRVEISKGFFLGKHEVTRAQFGTFVKATGYKSNAERSGNAFGRRPDGTWGEIVGAKWQSPVSFSQTDLHPATCISWNDAKAFCEWASQKTGRAVRLPTEAEWEYACRAGSGTRFWFGDQETALEEHGWIKANSSMQTQVTGRKKPNAWSFYDLYGNVWEWCQDWAGPYEGDPRDPRGPGSGDSRVLRGGSWDSEHSVARSSFRYAAVPTEHHTTFGFRIAIQ